MLADPSPARFQAVTPSDTGLDPDAADSVFRLLALGHIQGVEGALLTLTNIVGGAPRALGAQMAVLADGRYCGYVSGGCVEAAVAGEAMRAIAAGRDETLRFGNGSPFLDIELPCGGGIDIHIHVRPDPALVETALERIAAREPFAIAFATAQGKARLTPHSDPRERNGFLHGSFIRHYHPQTQLVLIGEGYELAGLARLGRSCGLAVEAYLTAEAGAQSLEDCGARVTLLTGAALPALPVDPFTAIVFMLHDRFKESRLLESALGYDPFYIGALGSRRTHASRLDRLDAAGIGPDRLANLHGPVGLFGPTRTASALAISVLAEITEARARLDG
ncbi:MAG TPA: XdhC family protein [Devosia sp.]|nr:XdhC family protein [Devosia sp.]